MTIMTMTKRTAQSWTKAAEPTHTITGIIVTETTSTSTTMTSITTTMLVGAVSWAGTVVGTDAIGHAVAAVISGVIAAVVAARRVVGAGAGLTPTQATERHEVRWKEGPVAGAAAGRAESRSNDHQVWVLSLGRAARSRHNRLSAATRGPKTESHQLLWGSLPNHEPIVKHRTTFGETSDFASDTTLPVARPSADRQLQLQPRRRWTARPVTRPLIRLTSR